MLETLDLLGLGGKCQVVINRSTMESVMKAADVPDILGADQPFYIPNDFTTASQSINIGIPFVINYGKTDLSKAIFKMAEQLSSRREISPITSKQPSILSRTFSKNKHMKEGESS
jgi:pilus assembly protein CpaE